jgi:hypothetical protein
MRILSLSFLIVPLLMLFSCSTNENDPMGPEDESSTLKLTVTAADKYYISLSQNLAIDTTDTDPLINPNWDLSIENLTTIKLNGGSTAPGSVYAFLVDGIAFEDLNSAPESMYLTDDQNGLYIGDNWYFYDKSNHTVNPLDLYYVIRAINGQFYKFQITKTFFSSIDDGELTIKIEKLDAPASYDTQPTTGRVMMSLLPLSSEESVYFNFKDAKTVEISDETTSLEWDLKSSYVNIMVNGGTSGSGDCAAIMYTNANFDSITTIPSDGYVYDDTASESYAIGVSWYTYNDTTHVLSPNPNVYVIRTADGNYAKLEFIATDFSSQSAGISVIKSEYIENSQKF